MKNLPYAKGWWSFDLPGYRTCESTYCWYSYETLPPLEGLEFCGDFHWLGKPDQDISAQSQAQVDANLQHLQAQAEKLHLELPAEFLSFMRSPALQTQIPSCTACYFELAPSIIPNPTEDDSFLINFLHDQQEVLLWHLLLNRAGEQYVVVSPISLDSEDVEIAGIPADVLQANIFICAFSFEAFIYRFWLENNLWFAFNYDHELTPAQTTYLQHFRKTQS